MELRHLRTFVVAAETGNFTRTAERLEVSQAAVSQHVAVLESHYGQPLFDRAGRQMILTVAGHRLFDHARAVLDRLAEAEADIAGCETVVSGLLRIASSTVPAEWWLPDLLAGFRAVFPEVRESVTVSDSHAAAAAVAGGQADVGVVGELPGIDLLSARAVAEDELVLVVGRDHPLAGRRSISLRQLIQLPLIVRGAGSGSQRCVDEALQVRGVHRDELDIWMETNSADATRSAVARGLAAAFLSRAAVADDLEIGRLVRVPVREVRPRRQLYLVTATDRVIGSPLREFLSFAEAGQGRSAGG
ncbi:MAG: hypothetical protein CMJ65_06940 [Planctomycetaceae bacterium]|jgi:DNA-binding transcriptional LysR family regulator|nr:hypothetical protein [Planctomycetaceae bacterium]MDP7276188.1 LysR family transcriptional regulator [Planctomycetaceae bacterium]